MINLIKEYDISLYMDKLGNLFELAICYRKIELQRFITLFINSKYLDYLEESNPKYLYGKSANELLALILEEEPIQYEPSEYPTREYWLGTVVAYISQFYRISIRELNVYYPILKMLGDFDVYHEMDIRQYVDKMYSNIPLRKRLKEIRERCKMTQEELSLASGVSIRSIRAYEQNTISLDNAGALVVLKLANALSVTVEDLLL